MTNYWTFPFQWPALFGYNSLVWFPVSGNYYDIEQPPLTGNVTQPTVNIVTASVTFFARVPVGFALYIPTLYTGQGQIGDVSISFPPVQARVLSGQLQTIDQDNAPGIELLANTAVVTAALQSQLGQPTLIFDVQYSNVTFANAPQQILNFAFEAPTSATPVCLTDPNLTRLPYAGPNTPYVLPP